MSIIPIKDDKHWHSMREKTIGASEVGIVMGVSPYGTLNELFHVKRGNFQQDLEGSKIMQWGNAMEPVIATVIAGEMNWDLRHCKEYHTHPEYPFLGTTLDYHVVESEHGPGILEIKNVCNFSPNWTRSRAPDHVELQIQDQFLIVNAARIAEGLPAYTWGAIGSMHAGNPEDTRIMYRKPDPKVHKHIIKQCGEFWQRVVDNDEPDLMSHKELDHIQGMFKQAEDHTFEPELMDRQDDPVLDDLIMQHLQFKHEAKIAKHGVDDTKAKILHRLMAIGNDGVTKQIAARTKNYGVETKLIEVHKSPSPAKVSQQLRFKIREVE